MAKLDKFCTEQTLTAFTEPNYCFIKQYIFPERSERGGEHN